jgi:hypothetical protein
VRRRRIHVRRRMHVLSVRVRLLRQRKCLF